MTINDKATLVISARGRDSFSSSQISQLSSSTICAVPNSINDKEFIRMAEGMRVVALTRRPQISITTQLLDQLPDLEALCVYSTGLEWIDLNELRKRSILLHSLEDYCSTSVAEHTVGMLLTQSRRLVLSDMKSNHSIPENISLRGFEISGKSVGIIGLGRIGRKIADLLTAFNCSIKYSDIDQKDLKYERVSKEVLLADSDIVVLACPYDGKFEIASHDLSLMKGGSVLINPSRKDLVDENSVLKCLRAKKLHSYAVDDVISNDIKDMEHGRVLQTYHTAWYSDEVMTRGTQMWVDNICFAQKEVGNYEK